MSLELGLVLVVPTLGGKSFSHPKMPWDHLPPDIGRILDFLVP